MGWSYMVICLFDFMIGPVAYNLLQIFYSTDLTELQKWEPLTLQAGGLYHFSMMAIVGVTAYGRTREKIKDMQLGKD
jgi:hypothetical protein